MGRDLIIRVRDTNGDGRGASPSGGGGGQPQGVDPTRIGNRAHHQLGVTRGDRHRQSTIIREAIARSARRCTETLAKDLDNAEPVSVQDPALQEIQTNILESLLSEAKLLHPCYFSASREPLVP